MRIHLSRSETITFVDSDSSGRSTKRRPAPSFCLRRPATSTVRCCECVGQQHQDGQLADNFLLFPHDTVRPRDDCRIDGGLQHGDEAERAQFPRKQHFAQQHLAHGWINPALRTCRTKSRNWTTTKTEGHHLCLLRLRRCCLIRIMTALPRELHFRQLQPGGDSLRFRQSHRSFSAST